MSIKPEDLSLQFLYKYRDIESYNESGQIILHDNTRNILEKGELWFSKPSAFNDPFDCHLSFEDGYQEEDARNFLWQNGFSKSEIKEALTRYKKNPQLIEQFKDPSTTDLFRILCLSKVRDNILMWSHYSKNHSGICIGIKANQYQNTFCIQANLGQLQNYVDCGTGMIPGIYVNYTDDYPPAINLFNRTDEDIKPFFLNKSKQWEYEQELRFLVMEQNLFGSGEKSHVAPVGKSQFLTNEKNQNYPNQTSFLE